MSNSSLAFMSAGSHQGARFIDNILLPAILVLFAFSFRMQAAPAPLLSSAGSASVTRIPSSPSADEITMAKADLANGLVVAMVDADPSTFSTLFNVVLPKPQNPTGRTPLRYYVIAA